MLGIMRRIWAPEWKYITEPPRPHPQILFQIHIELEVRRPQIWIWKKKKKKKKNGIPFNNGKFSCLIYITSIHEPTNEYA